MTWWQTLLIGMVPAIVAATALIVQQREISKRDMRAAHTNARRDWARTEFERRRETYSGLLQAYQRYMAERGPQTLQLLGAVQRGDGNLRVIDVLGTVPPSREEGPLYDAIGAALLWAVGRPLANVLAQLPEYISGLEWFLVNPEQGEVWLAANSRGDLEAGFRDVLQAIKKDLEDAEPQEMKS